jgi:hypothetical protein
MVAIWRFSKSGLPTRLSRYDSFFTSSPKPQSTSLHSQKREATTSTQSRNARPGPAEHEAYYEIEERTMRRSMHKYGQTVALSSGLPIVLWAEPLEHTCAPDGTSSKFVEYLHGSNVNMGALPVQATIVYRNIRC